MPVESISMCSKTLYMSNMEAGSNLRRLSASTMNGEGKLTTINKQTEGQSKGLCVASSSRSVAWTIMMMAQALCHCDDGQCLLLPEGLSSLTAFPHPLWLHHCQCLRRNPHPHGDCHCCLPPSCPVVLVVFHPP